MTVMLTARQVCEQLQISRRTLARYAQAGRVTPVHLSAAIVRFHPDDIAQLANSDMFDRLATIRAARARVAEQHAEDDRPICTGCGKRRAPKTGGWCQYCDEAAEIDRKNKREWWGRNQPKRVTINGKRVYVKPDKAATP